MNHKGCTYQISDSSTLRRKISASGKALGVFFLFMLLLSLNAPVAFAQPDPSDTNSMDETFSLTAIGKSLESALTPISDNAALFAESASATSSPFASGSGTESDPYIIADKSQLEAFRDAVNSGNTYKDTYISLSQDIDISGSQWTPIGASTRSSSGITSDSTPFSGVFNGNGHTISGLTITPTGTQSKGADYALGLFGAVMGGTVENLKLSDVDIDDGQSELAGGAVGLASENATISNVEVSGNIEAECGCGGIVGRMTLSGTISGCTNSASVTVTGGSGNCGGIVGAAYYTADGNEMDIMDCTNNGTINGLNDTGGIVGLCSAFVSGCTNNATVTGSGYSTGGIAGELKNYGSVTHCLNTAKVTNTSNDSPYGTGGIVGWVRYDGTGSAYSLSAPIDIADNTNKGDVEATTGVGVGGIVGVLYSAGTVTGNENDAGSLSGSKFVGGIVGDLQDQGSSTLPSEIKEGATVVNNVSTTPLSNMSGQFKNQYAYNNDPSIFTVEGNGTAWVAQDESTGDTRYASLPYAVSKATPDDTVTLIADSNDTDMLEPPQNSDITLDLNGHSIEFDSKGGITAKGDTVTIEGDGDLYMADRESDGSPQPVLFQETTSDDGQSGKIVLKGGTYPTDVDQYVAAGYTVKKLSEPDAANNSYQVVKEDSPAPQPATTTDSGSSNPTPSVKSPTPVTPSAQTVGSDASAKGNSLAQVSDDTDLTPFVMMFFAGALLSVVSILGYRRKSGIASHSCEKQN